MPIDGLTHDVTHPIDRRSAPARQQLAAEAYAVIKQWVDSCEAANLMTRPEC